VASLAELIARRKYGRAIELLRSQLEGRLSPGPQLRLQLADLLMLAGRGGEAVPILVGLADEFAGDGFVAKAVAILKRVEKVAPGRPDVEERLVALVRRQRTEPLAISGVARPRLDIEEIDAALPLEPALDAFPAAAEETAAPPEIEALLSPLDLETAPAVATTAEPAPADVPSAEAAPAEAPVQTATSAPEAASEPPSPAGVVGRLRGAFRRLFSADGEEPLPGEAAPAPILPSEAAAPEVLLEPGSPEPATEPASETGTGWPAETAADVDAMVEPVADEQPVEVLDETVPLASEALAGAAGPAAAEAATLDRIEVSPLPVEWAVQPEPDRVEPEDDAAQALEAALPDVASVDPLRHEAGEAAVAHAEDVTERIRRAFHRFLVSLPGGTDAAGASEPTADAVATPVEPLPEESPEPPPEPEPEPAALSEAAFEERVLDLIEDVLQRPAAPAAPAALDTPVAGPPASTELASRLLASPLFAGLSEEELLAVVHELDLRTFEPGEVIVTEGEPGDSLFILAAGTAKVFVRNPEGRNFAIGGLREGDFFGEVASLSGRARTATVTAATPCELLALAKPAVDRLARSHPEIRETIEAHYIRRASSPEAAAVRAVPLGDAPARERAIEVLEAHFGESRWDPRMRLRLADLLLKSGHEDDALPILLGLADELTRQGQPARAIAILKKIEQVQRRHVEEVNLAPLRRPAAREAPLTASGQDAPRARRGPGTEAFFDQWLVEMLRETVRQRAEPADQAPLAAPEVLAAYARGLGAGPLFQDFSEDELLALVRSLRLLFFEAGDIVVSQGEPGRSVFILAAGEVRVHVRDNGGHDRFLTSLGEGAFFGEIGALSGRPRSASVVAASRCELLELDQPALQALEATHPRVRAVLEDFYVERAAAQRPED
jgi:CRP-like cAMP-binding protein